MKKRLKKRKGAALKKKRLMKRENRIIITSLVSILIAVCLVSIVIFLTVPQAFEIKVVEQQPAVIEAPAEGELPPITEPFIVKLTAQKIMVPSEIKIKAGTTVEWENEDNSPHYLIIYKKTIYPVLAEEEIVRSYKFYPKLYVYPCLGTCEEVARGFKYIFTETGEYVVRDVYTESMRGEITAKVIMMNGMESGRIIVE